MKDKVTIYPGEDGRISLQAFDHLLDITKVVYYSLDKLPGGKLLLRFYDENKELIENFVS